MLFSKAAVHGIYMLCYLSRQDAGSVTSAITLAKAVDAPPEHTRKILMRLSAAGLVTATNGRSGGYASARDMKDISVLDVLDAISPVADVQSLQPRMCAAAPDDVCSVQPGLANLWEQTRALLANTALATIAGKQCCRQASTCEVNGCEGCRQSVDEIVAAS